MLEILMLSISSSGATDGDMIVIPKLLFELMWLILSLLGIWVALLNLWLVHTGRRINRLVQKLPRQKP